MVKHEGYKIEVESSFAAFWRYNVALMCGCFDANDQRTGFAAAEDTIAPVGSGLTEPPADYPVRRKATLEVPEADHLLLYIYIIPHALPDGPDVADRKPFPLQIRITHAGTELLTTSWPINQWSGASIELKVGSETSRI